MYGHQTLYFIKYGFIIFKMTAQNLSCFLINKSNHIYIGILLFSSLTHCFLLILAYLGTTTPPVLASSPDSSLFPFFCLCWCDSGLLHPPFSAPFSSTSLGRGWGGRTQAVHYIHVHQHHLLVIGSPHLRHGAHVPCNKLRKRLAVGSDFKVCLK